MGVNSLELSQIIVEGMQKKKAGNIVVLDLRGIKNVVSDFFVICSGSSARQLGAIVDAVDRFVFKSLREAPWHIEGKNSEEWILLDYVDVVAHIFRDSRRALYGLEDLWGDAKVMKVENGDRRLLVH